MMQGEVVLYYTYTYTYWSNSVSCSMLMRFTFRFRAAPASAPPSPLVSSLSSPVAAPSGGRRWADEPERLRFLFGGGGCTQISDQFMIHGTTHTRRTRHDTRRKRLR